MSNQFDSSSSEQSYNSGQMPPEPVVANYQNFVQTAPESEVRQVHQEYFNQMPRAEQMGLFSGLVNALGGQYGFDPRKAGVTTTDPQQASSTDLGNLFNYAINSGVLSGLVGGSNQPNQQHQGGLSGLLSALFGNRQQEPTYSGQQPPGGGLQGLLSNPMAQAALSGLIAYAANRFMNNMGSQGRQQYSSQSGQGNWSQNQPQNYQGGGSTLPGFENDQQNM